MEAKAEESARRADVTDQEFVQLFEQHGALLLSKIIGIDVRAVLRRRERLELKLSRRIISPNATASRPSDYPKRIPIKLLNGIAIIGSDGHYWPDIVSAAHRGLVKLIGKLKPKVLILNGDCFDGARISRHPPIGWKHAPTLIDEMRAVEARTDEIRAVAKGAALYWTIGNHDARFENKLSSQVPEYAGVDGFNLKDQFPHWNFCWSIWINNEVVIKHRFKGGIHATHNNTLWAGKTIVTGHLHSLKVTPFTDYNGIRYGVDTGTLAEPDGPQFEYTEDNPLNHRSGFIVLTFKDGKLLWPEIVSVVDTDHIQFRGQVIRV